MTTTTKLEGFKNMNKEQDKKLYQLAKEYGFNCGEILMIGDYFGFDIVNQIFKHRQHELHKRTLFNICESYQEDISSYEMDRQSEELELKTY